MTRPDSIADRRRIGEYRRTGKAKALQGFVAVTEGGYRVVVEGEELPASDELVKANPDLFKK